MSVVLEKFIIPIPRGKTVNVEGTSDTEIYDVTVGRCYTITNLIIANNGTTDITIKFYDGSSTGTLIGTVIAPAKETIFATELIGREIYDDLTADATTGTPSATNYVAITVSGYER